MTFELLSLCPPPFVSEEQKRLHCLCPVRVLHTYIDRTQSERLCDQLFVCFANPVKGKALFKQWLSHWTVEAISLAYNNRGLPLPQGGRAHSARGMTTSWALFKEVSLSDICAAASWSSPHTFVLLRAWDLIGQLRFRRLWAQTHRRCGPLGGRQWYCRLTNTRSWPGLCGSFHSESSGSCCATVACPRTLSTMSLASPGLRAEAGNKMLRLQALSMLSWRGQSPDRWDMLYAGPHHAGRSRTPEDRCEQ